MRKNILILAFAFAGSLLAQDFAVPSQQNIFTAPQRFKRGIVIDCRSLVDEPLSPVGRGKIACDSGTFTLKASFDGGSFVNIGGSPSDLLPLPNTWTGTNTFSNTLHLNGAVTDWSGGQLLAPRTTGAVSGQHGGGVQLGAGGAGAQGYVVFKASASDPIGTSCASTPTLMLWAQNGGGSARALYLCGIGGTWATVLRNTGNSPIDVTGTVNTPDTTAGVFTVTNASTADFTTAIGAVAAGVHSYGVRAVGGEAGVFGESVTGSGISNGGQFYGHATGVDSAGVFGQQLADSTNATYGGSFLNGGTHATNYGVQASSNGGPAAWFANGSANTQPTLLVREGFGGQGAIVPQIAVDNDSDVRTFAVRADGTTVHNGGVLDIVGAGAPSGACVTGSMYRRTDGTLGATLYICEATAWAAK